MQVGVVGTVEHVEAQEKCFVKPCSFKLCLGILTPLCCHNLSWYFIANLPFMLQVKVLSVRNLMLTTTEAQIEEAFSTHAPVERVKKIKDYAFVHFGTKQHAHIAMEAMNGKQ